METIGNRFRTFRIFLDQLLKVFFYIFLFVMGIPLLIGLLTGIQSGVVLGFISSIFLLQATASPLGVPLGFPPTAIMAIMVSYALGTTLAILEICDTFARTSERVKNWLERTEKKIKKYTFLHKYGAVSCIFISWIPGLGLYSTPVIGWLIRWKRPGVVFFTVLGFFLVSLVFLLLAEGVIKF